MKEKQWITKTSGEQQHFNTGAKRDTQKGKGRFDLLPSYTMRKIAQTYSQLGKSIPSSKKSLGVALSYLYDCLSGLSCNVEALCIQTIWHLLEHMEGEQDRSVKYEQSDCRSLDRFDLIPYTSLKRVADIFERGAREYGARNWENGMNLSRLLDSAIRHLHQALADKDDEDHYGAACWNAIAFIETKWRIDNGYLPKELDDLPILKKIEQKKEPTIIPHVDICYDKCCSSAHGCRFYDGYGNISPAPTVMDGYFSEIINKSAEKSTFKTMCGNIIGSSVGPNEPVVPIYDVEKIEPDERNSVSLLSGELLLKIILKHNLNIGDCLDANMTSYISDSVLLEWESNSWVELKRDGDGISKCLLTVGTKWLRDGKIGAVCRYIGGMWRYQG